MKIAYVNILLAKNSVDRRDLILQWLTLTLAKCGRQSINSLKVNGELGIVT